MNQAQLARALASELGRSKQQSEEIVEALVRILGRTLAQGEPICFSNFGTLRPTRRKSTSTAPGTQLDEAKPDTLQVRFRAAHRLLAALESGNHQVDFRKRRGSVPSAR